ncbi:HEPN domain-containing protein [Flammeovirga yaeyamensis]|uniref:HEPN domain-containing protein n=1 Tax=Flammeovirga yaeyamensis TaxID=367791 RepID=A0AAX1N759_9BACT|nr:HEPN domain-containing protein [Flammeovirga yaeyamensis]MBB3697902.1 sulfite reductase (ferredoxin) [Flammeovirga yaeyamensis]NMF35743.1 HEPN domain-containing protein [Flammeovirga yaeyamensis]QWG03304.1 HEPN domain-containing protein [Flammeovirga yaeyamensis]
MQSFRTELENPVVEQDILDLEKKIRLFHNGEIDDDKFRSLRLARGVYGQRQPGVQMIRIKIPYGKLTTRQLNRICDVSDEYSNGKLHITTRQDIQIHYVSLDDSPRLWHELEKDEVTLREACGNTVRNITASELAGIDPAEPFDVTPYAHATFEYFLRNPICQEMGRKFKIAFSSSVEDTAFAFIHDVGAIPVVKTIDGEERRGFKVLIGGGLGAQPYMAETAYEFLEEEKLIPFTESLIRVFDRHGERNRRMKARMKFLIQDIGKEELLRLAQEEFNSLENKEIWVDRSKVDQTELPKKGAAVEVEIKDQAKFDKWSEANVFEQKQEGYYGVLVRLPLGNFDTTTARTLSQIVTDYAADDIRLTIRQGILLKYVQKENLKALFNALDAIGFAEPGYDTTADITACPGTDTCVLGISSSTGLARVLGDLIKVEYPDLLTDDTFKIKISGCPNACGQHTIAQFGIHGSSLRNKENKMLLPAAQILLGGGFDGESNPHIADKVIKIPSKRIQDAFRAVVDDYDQNAPEGQYFVDYYKAQGKEYFYDLLKHLGDLSTLVPEDYLDWYTEVDKFELHKAVGECAGVIIDLVQTLILEAEEKVGWANEAISKGLFADAVYHTYQAYVSAAKALLLDKKVKLNSHMTVINRFAEHYDEKLQFAEGSFVDHVLRINKNEPTAEFAQTYFDEIKVFLENVSRIRKEDLQEA